MVTYTDPTRVVAIKNGDQTFEFTDFGYYFHVYQRKYNDSDWSTVFWNLANGAGKDEDDGENVWGELVARAFHLWVKGTNRREPKRRPTVVEALQVAARNMRNAVPGFGQQLTLLRATLAMMPAEEATAYEEWFNEEMKEQGIDRETAEVVLWTPPSMDDLINDMQGFATNSYKRGDFYKLDVFATKMILVEYARLKALEDAGKLTPA